MLNLPYYKQTEEFTCGPVCLQMLFEFFDKKLDSKKISSLVAATALYGTSHLALIRVVKNFGFYSYAHTNSSLKDIKYFIDLGLPVLVNYLESSNNEGHYALVVGYTLTSLVMNDPWNGEHFKINFKEFDKRWFNSTRRSRKSLLVISDKKIKLASRK